jgi:hypothetical protein
VVRVGTSRRKAQVSDVRVGTPECGDCRKVRVAPSACRSCAGLRSAVALLRPTGARCG